MKTISYKKVVLDGGYLFDKQELNRKVTINSVYDRFKETGRIDAFKLGYPKNGPIRPHFFWDSDVLYSDSVPETEDTVLHLIPYNFFANRDKTDMRVWFLTEK